MSTTVLENPDTIRLVGICDPHLSPANPVSWKVDYREHTEKVLESVFQFARDKQAHAVVWAGDIFHRKTPAQNPLWFVARTIKMLKESGLRHIGIAGNHDLKYGSLEGLSGQPIEVLIEAGVYHLLDGAPVQLKASTFTVEVQGASYYHGRAEPVVQLARSTSDVNYLLAVGHFWFGKESGEFYGEPIFGPDVLGTGDADAYLIGHHHEDQGIVKDGKKQYVAVGSINKTGTNKSDLSRRPAAVFMEFSPAGINIKAVRPKFLPAEETFDLERKAQREEEEQELTEYMEVLSSYEVTLVDPEQILQDLPIDKAVKEVAQDYLRKAEGEMQNG